MLCLHDKWMAAKNVNWKGESKRSRGRSRMTERGNYPTNTIN